MIDHVGFAVGDLGRSRAFFEAALEPLDITLIVSVTAAQTGHGGHLGFGSGPRPFFWIGEGKAPAGTTHVAFAVETREAVEAFHAAALAAGGRDNGAPGLRPHYHPDYYAAFVLDPDGNNIEAVCHAPA